MFSSSFIYLIRFLSCGDKLLVAFCCTELTTIYGTKMPCVFLSFSSDVSVLIIPDNLTIYPVITLPTMFYLVSQITCRGVLPYESISCTFNRCTNMLFIDYLWGKKDLDLQFFFVSPRQRLGVEKLPSVII